LSYRITITGDLGSGKSTVCSILSERLGVETFSTGALHRAFAAERGLSTKEMNVYMEKHPEMDREIDDELVARAASLDGFVIDSRLAWHFVPDTLKVDLLVDVEIAARRIINDERGSSESYASIDSAIEQLTKRKASENYRYREFYGVDCSDVSNYNVVVDTSSVAPGAVAELLVGEYARWEADKGYQRMWLPARKLVPARPAQEADEALVRRYVEQLGSGTDIGPILGRYSEGLFFVTSGHRRLAAYAAFAPDLIPCAAFERGKSETGGNHAETYCQQA
jgi:cytidylate kinase